MNDTQPQKIAIAGLGREGLSTALALARAGQNVTAWDSDSDRIDILNSGSSYLSEIPDTLIQEALESHEIRFEPNVDSVWGADWVIVAIPIPSRSDGWPETRHFASSVRALSKNLPGAPTVGIFRQRHLSTAVRIIESEFKCNRTLVLGHALIELGRVATLRRWSIDDCIQHPACFVIWKICSRSLTDRPPDARTLQCVRSRFRRIPRQLRACGPGAFATHSKESHAVALNPTRFNHRW